MTCVYTGRKLNLKLRICYNNIAYLQQLYQRPHLYQLTLYSHNKFALYQEKHELWCHNSLSCSTLIRICYYMCLDL